MRRLVVPPGISRKIGALLSRNGVVRLLSRLHEELPARYGRYRGLRHPDDDGSFLFFVVVAEGRMHSFTFFIDDSTSPDHLLVQDVEHNSRPLSL